MSRTAAAAATVIAVLMAGAAVPALAPTAPEARVAPVTAPARIKADEATRAAYERRDALSRSVFWANEQQADPMDPVAGVKLPQALRELGRFDAAAEAAQNTLLVQPENTEAMLELGRAHWARGQAFYGIAALEKARDLTPGDWRPWSLLGAAYQQARRHDDAAAPHRGLQGPAAAAAARRKRPVNEQQQPPQQQLKKERGGRLKKDEEHRPRCAVRRRKRARRSRCG